MTTADTSVEETTATTDTMQAIVHHRFGAPNEVLAVETVTRPSVGVDDVLVRVHASSANPYDWHFIRAEPWFIRLSASGSRKPKHPIPGGDLAGVVEAVGRNVTDFEAGDEVYAFHHGAFAEYIVVPVRKVARKPRNLTFEEAATVPLAAVTALQGLRDHGGISAGDEVLIIGASGGVGTMAVQIAKALGAHVTGVCSTKNLEFVRSLGADEVIDYTAEDFTRRNVRYDLVFQLGGTYTARQLRRAMSKNGTLIQAMGDGGPILGPVLNIISSLVLNLFVSQSLKTFTAIESAEFLDEVREMIEAGHVRPVIDSIHPIAETGRAIEIVEHGSPQGKVAISIRPPTPTR